MNPEDASRPPAAPAPASPPPSAPPLPVASPEALRDAPWQKGPGGVKEKRRRYGNHLYRLVKYPAGYKQETPTVKQQVGLVLAGRATLKVGRRLRPIRAGQSLIFPKGLERTLRVGRNPLVLFVVEPAGAKRRRRRGGRGKGKKIAGAAAAKSE